MNKKEQNHQSYWKRVGGRYARHKLGMFSLFVVILFCLVGVYAPFLASSKPLVVNYHGEWYFPLFRYLFYTGFYTKPIDIFFNLLIFTLPFLVITLLILRKRKKSQYAVISAFTLFQVGLFILFSYGVIKDPAADVSLNIDRQSVIQGEIQKTEKSPLPSWDFDLNYMNDYAKLNLVLKFILQKQQDERLKEYQDEFQKASTKKWFKTAIKEKKASLLREGIPLEKIPSDDILKEMIAKEIPIQIITSSTAMPTLWHQSNQHRINQLKNLDQTIHQLKIEGKIKTPAYKYALAKKNYIIEKNQWLNSESSKIKYLIQPILRSFHWQDDAGGDQNLNKYISWWEITRINRKDMLSALIFGVRISLVVGITAVCLSLIIGVPIGATAGYYGGTFDIIVSRLLEIWESMPTFFMLLLVVAITQSKSIYLIITVIGIFGWTSFSRYVRGEFFKQRNLSYVEACHALGFHDRDIIFSHILPNAIPPLLTLLPFAIMGAITSEAGLSFLGLGEEGSCSWGVLMDEGRTAFPGESYLLWPPAILLTILLIAIALVGDALRDALDPKLLR